MPIHFSRHSFRRLSLCRRLAVTSAALLVGLLPSTVLADGSVRKAQYVGKSVPCAPCPCQCPDNQRPPPPTPLGPAPAPRPIQPKANPSAGNPTSAPTKGPSVTGADLSGVVTLYDLSGKQNADRSSVLVYIERIPNKRYAPLKRVRQMAQRDKAFVPGLVAITRGSTVAFPNEDKFFHNVFSLSTGNAFDLQMYAAGQSKSITFTETGVVDVYCNIHANMWGQILVLDNPFFTTAERDGSFTIPNVPPGTYSVAAVVFGGEPVRQQVKMEPGKPTLVSFFVREGMHTRPHGNKFNQPYSGVYPQ